MTRSEKDLFMKAALEEAKKGVEIDEDKIIDTKNLLSLKIKNAKQLDLFIIKIIFKIKYIIYIIRF